MDPRANVSLLIEKLKEALKLLDEELNPGEKNSVDIQFYIGDSGPFESVKEMEEKDYDFDEEYAVAELLKANVLFLNSRKYYCNYDKKLQPETLVLFLNCNDTFAWGCADAEEVKSSELEELYKLYKKYGYSGTTIWVCKKRNEQPQKPVREWLEKEGVFDQIKELPENKYDELVRKDYPDY